MELDTIALLELYEDTLYKCGLFLLNEEDSLIEYNIFEEFDTGIHSFFHDENLKKLFDANLIDKKVMKKSSELREKVICLQRNNEWDLKYFKSSVKWFHIMVLCDEIKDLLKRNKA